jgi:hypothetical protein
LEELYEGTASIFLFDESYMAYVILRPKNGDIVVKIPHGRIDGWELLEKVREGEFFGKEYELENLEIITPLGKISRSSLNVYPILVSPGPLSILDSSVLRIAYSSQAGIATFVFRPKESFLVFEGQVGCNLDDGSYSSYYELLFSGFRPKILPGVRVNLEEDTHLSLQAGEENRSPSGKKLPEFQGNFVIVRSENLNLFESSIREDLYRTLSLLNGGKVLLNLGYALTVDSKECKFKVAFNLDENSRTILRGIGNPFRFESSDEYLELVKTFIESFLSHVRQLEGRDKRQFNLFVEYLIEGISMNAILESKLITLYNALEIMDNARTLNKGDFKKAYELDECKAYFFTELRNKIVHEGLSVEEAVEKAQMLVRSKNPNCRNFDASF